MGKGKRYEQESCTLLREYGFVAERIRGSGGGTGTRSGDILFLSNSDWPDGQMHIYGARGTDVRGLSIGNALEQDIVSEGQVLDAEVKYDSNGYSRLYTRHFEQGFRKDGDWIIWKRDDDVFASAHYVKVMSYIRNRMRSDGTRLQNFTKRYGNTPVKAFRDSRFACEPTRSLQKVMRGNKNCKNPDVALIRRPKSDFGPVDWVGLLNEHILRRFRRGGPKP